MDRIVFLGTGGARFVMARQILATGGLWLVLNGTQIALDPGPGAIVHARKHRLDPAKLAGIVISHRHLDHCGDVNVMIEAMTEGGTRRQGTIYAPADALEEDPVVLRYLRPFVEEVVVLEPLRRYRVGATTFETSMPHRHGAVQTFGFRFFTGDSVVCYLPDTRYFPELADFYRGEVLILAVLLKEPKPGVPHLSVPEARELLSVVRPKVAILTHFGTTVWQARPWELAARLSEETGVRVIAARDGMEFPLEF
ncbi:MAG: MBL fold metallo-hydrolase [Moorellales bacterium]